MKKFQSPDFFTVRNIRTMGLKRLGFLTVSVIIWSLSFAQLRKEDCPNEEDIKPCTCAPSYWSELTCQGVKDLETLKNVFKNSAGYNYHKLFLKHSSIAFFPSDMFEKTHVDELHLEDDALVRLFDIPPDTLSDLQVISMINTRLFRMRWDLLEPFTKLFTLRIHFSPIETLGSHFSIYVTKELVDLEFKGTKTKTIKPGVFKDFVKLLRITIESCELTTLSRDMFPKPFKVYSLYFNKNKIAAIPEDLFTDMPDLHTVNLEENQIAVLPELAFRDLFNYLSELLLEGNPLKCDCLLYWLVKDSGKKPELLQGKCASPKNLNGKDIKDLTTGDFNC